MTDSRTTVLGRLRDARALAPPAEREIPRAYRTGRTLPDADRVDLLVDRLLDYRALVHRASADSLAGTVADALRESGARRVAIPPGLDPSWVAATDAEIVVDSPDLPAPRLADVDAVVTGSTVTCAETGTIFLDGSPDQGRRALTLVPDVHVCVVGVDTIAVGVPEALARLVPERPTTLVSGPSATSDIELERVEGVHGPRTLHVVIVDPPSDRPPVDPGQAGSGRVPS